MLPKWAWSGSREQFLHCGLRKFCHSKSSVYRWYTQSDCRPFVYDTWDNGSRLSRVMVECTLFITHCLRLNLQLHTISLVRTCRISSFCTVAWQLARLLLTRRIAQSLGDSWASCTFLVLAYPCCPGKEVVKVVVLLLFFGCRLVTLISKLYMLHQMKTVMIRMLIMRMKMAFGKISAHLVVNYAVNWLHRVFSS